MKYEMLKELGFSNMGKRRLDREETNCISSFLKDLLVKTALNRRKGLVCILEIEELQVYIDLLISVSNT